MWRRDMRSGAVRVLGVVLLLVAVSAQGADLPFTLQWRKVADVQVYTNAIYRRAKLSYHGVLADGRLLYKATPAGAADEHQYRILLFDPQTNAFAWKAALPAAFRASPGNILPQQMWPLPDGRVLAMHRTAWNGPLKSWLYNPGNDTFEARADLAPSLADQSMETLVPLSGGRLLFSGGSSRDAARKSIDGPGYIHDLAANTWSSGPAFPAGTLSVGSLSTAAGRCSDWSRAGFHLFNYSSRGVTSASVGTFDQRGMTWTIYRLSEDVAMGSEGPQVNGVFYANCSPYQTVGGQFDPVSRVFTWWEPAGPGYGGGGLFRVYAQGQDWLGQVFAGDQTSPWQCKVFDPATGAWMTGPPGTWPGYKSMWTPLPQGGGIAITGVHPPASTNFPVYRLVLTSGGGAVAPFVNPLGVPTSITLNEGANTNFDYRVAGDLPPEGVETVLEHISGDGDVRVVDGARYRVTSRNQTLSVRVAGLTDADANDDDAVLRLRVVGAADDPKAIRISVRVRDPVR